MNTRAIFGIATGLSFVSSIVAGTLLVLPWAESQGLYAALLWLLVPHMFLRFIGLSFLIPGVVSANVPRAWAVPAAYGDLVAGILAIIAVLALTLTHMAPWAIGIVWIFNIWGALDLLYAGYIGQRLNVAAGALGAGYYIVTAIAPPLLVSHALIFVLLVR
jgi:hypothetical protein